MDVVASRAHYAAHLAPVAALVEDVEGVLVASYGDLCTVRGRYDRIVLMQHGAGQSYSDRHPGYPGGDDNEAVGLFLTPGEHPAARWRARYPGTPAVAVGSPRVESLPDRQGDSAVTVAVSFHWRTGSVPEARTAFDWYREALPGLRDAFHLIGTGHPRASRLPRVYAGLGIEYVADFEEVCRRADVLIADNTSALFEFAATGRNVVVLNAPWYRKEARHGLRFWDAASVGEQVEHPGDLVEAVTVSMFSDPTDRQAAVDMVYSHRSGSAQRAADAIREWAA